MRSTLTCVAHRGAGAAAAALLVATAASVITPHASAAGSAAAGPDSAARSDRSVIVRRGGSDATLRFHRAAAGEVFLAVTVSARGVSWATRGNESAVVSAYVDGHYATDIVITSVGPVARHFALGHLRAGGHTLRLHYASGRSPSNAGVARLQDIGFSTVRPSDPAYVAAKYAPVLYGRNIAGLGGRFENNRTDTPLVAWHQVLPAARAGHSVIEYSVVWSNEDGGTGASAGLLMAQWGRTTDIEWIYRVEVDAKGRRVPGSGVFQSPNHGTTAFRGGYDGTHPLLQTCTSNNNVCDAKALKGQHQRTDPMRFGLSTRGVLGAAQPREHEMDINPWTYQVMGREMVRENKVESSPDPSSTPLLGDARTYLYLAVTHDTQPPASAGGVGLTVEVTLRGDPTTYSSNHDNALGLGSVNRNGPAATTVELPVGTRAADVASISVRRVAIGPDNGASLHVTELRRAFFLGTTYKPFMSFARRHLDVTLTQATPSGVIWPRP
jgi:hypothetical protein